MRVRLPLFVVLFLVGLTTITYPILNAIAPQSETTRITSEWPSWGNDPGGMRYSPLKQISPDNVSRLKVAWMYRTGDRSDGKNPDIPSATAFEATPILVNGRLVFCTPFNRVIALDPLTGARQWIFDPKINLKVKYENQLSCRGVSAWTDADRPAAICRTRIFTGTNDGRLFAIDANSGRPCTDFADEGQIDLKRDVGRLRWAGEYQVTSPPAIIGNLVVVGSAVADNQRTDAPSGVVRAFDARSGKIQWAQDLAPPGYNGPRSSALYALGTPNVWSIMSVDETLKMIYLPTGNPAPDFFRGDRQNMDYYGSSVVALDADTGKVAWRFQTVHHDLWDYDVPSQPALFTFYKEDGTTIPALAQGTKTGHLFILDRRTGEPLFGVTEKPAPQLGVPGEVLSPTQPVPNRPPPLATQILLPENVDSSTSRGRRCRQLLQNSMRSEGIFTPPSFRDTVLLPGSGGGLNWSGSAIDPERRLLITNSTDVAWKVRLFPGDQFFDQRKADPTGEVRPQDGTPVGMQRSFFTEKFAFFFDVPCNPPPWGHLNVVDLRTGELKQRRPLGRAFGTEGLPSLGGAIVTASGLAFIAGTIRDDSIRAFDVQTLEEKWRHALPAGGQATPMTYEVRLENGRSRQFVVIAAGGNPRATTTPGDYLVAFSLPE